MKQLLQQVAATTALLCLHLTSAHAQVTIPVGSTTRSLIIYAPPALPANRPLLISMHGSGQSADYQQAQAKWEQVADTAKFLAPDHLQCAGHCGDAAIVERIYCRCQHRSVGQWGLYPADQ